MNIVCVSHMSYAQCKQSNALWVDGSWFQRSLGRRCAYDGSIQYRQRQKCRTTQISDRSYAHRSHSRQQIAQHIGIANRENGIFRWRRIFKNSLRCEHARFNSANDCMQKKMLHWRFESTKSNIRVVDDESCCRRVWTTTYDKWLWITNQWSVFIPILSCA